MLHRLLEPPEAELLERPSDADRAARRIAVIGIEGEREAVADQPAHGPRLGDVARDVAIEPGAVVVEADLDRGGIVPQARFDDAQHLALAALAIAADRGVERQARAPSAAEQLVDRLPEELALQIPQRDVDGRERAGQRALRTE